MKFEKDNTIGNDRILNTIFTVRGKKVIIDKHLSAFLKFDLSEIRGKIRSLKDQFPSNTLYELQPKEIDFLHTRNLIAEQESVGTVYAITAEGVLWLGATIGTKEVLDISNQIVHVFGLVKQMLANLEKLKNNLGIVKDKLKKIQVKSPPKAPAVDQENAAVLENNFVINPKYSDRFGLRFGISEC